MNEETLLLLIKVFEAIEKLDGRNQTMKIA